MARRTRIERQFLILIRVFRAIRGPSGPRLDSLSVCSVRSVVRSFRPFDWWSGPGMQGGGEGADGPGDPGDERDPGPLEHVARLVGQAEGPSAVEGDLDGLPSARGIARLAEGGPDALIV